jgi:hypothetical protein
MPVRSSPDSPDLQVLVAVDICEGNRVNLLKKYDYPKEVKQNWLGFSKTGNAGTGLGPDFAQALARKFHHSHRLAVRHHGAEAGMQPT